MPRKPRIEYSGAFYHVIVRGNQKQRVFKDAADFQKYLLTLTVYKNRTGCRIYAYVLMNNHLHLLIETQDVPLSKVMQGVNQAYTMYFNRRYRTVGHLFQGRYKAIVCDKEAYLLGLLKYIHQNPLRAKIAERLDHYPWSSHHAYTGKNNPLGLVDTDPVLRMFSESKARSRTKYREFMSEEETLNKAAVYATVDQRLQGSETFIETVQQKSEQPVEREKKGKTFALAAIARAVQEQIGISLDDLRSATKQARVMAGRRLLSVVSKTYGYKGKEIAEFLRKDPAAVTGYLRNATEERKIAAKVGASLK
jgi:REP element-mobilizing transposase RayT